MYDIRKLDVYNMALDFSNEIWEICNEWDWFPKKTIGSQLVQSADSIYPRSQAPAWERLRHSFQNIAFPNRGLGTSRKQKIESFLKEFPIKFNTYIKKIKEYIKNE